MTKCKFCGESNPDTSRFCARCGQPLVESDNSALTAALEAAQSEFDKDSMVTLDKSRITYVCSVCGSVNRIDQEKCSRCGKPRPRNEYVNALRRIKQSEQMREESETLVAPIPVTMPEPPAEQRQEAPAESAPVQQPAQVMANGQAVAIAQPFVVVPYVNPMQPLWQYQPDQLYRFEPYTEEELAAIRSRREMDELNARIAANAPADDMLPPAQDVFAVPEKKASSRSRYQIHFGALYRGYRSRSRIRRGIRLSRRHRRHRSGVRCSFRYTRNSVAYPQPCPRFQRKSQT